MNYLLDTNVICFYLKGDNRVINGLDRIRRLGEDVFLSGMSYYEIRRGLIAANATRKSSVFTDFCQQYEIITTLDNIAILEKGAEIHANLKQKGTPIQDADILIAATAIVCDLTLVSSDSDMLRVSDLRLENWIKDSSN